MWVIVITGYIRKMSGNALEVTNVLGPFKTQHDALDYVSSLDEDFWIMEVEDVRS